MIDLLIIRTLFVAVLASAAFFLHPFNLDGPVAAAVGAVVGAGVVEVAVAFRLSTVEPTIATWDPSAETARP